MLVVSQAKSLEVNRFLCLISTQQHQTALIHHFSPWSLDVCESQWWCDICHVVLVWERKSELSQQREAQRREQKAFSKCANLSSFHASSLSPGSTVSFSFFFFFLSVCRTAFTQQTCPFKTGFLLVFTFYLVYLVDFTWLVNWWKISLFIDFSILNSKYSFVSFIYVMNIIGYWTVGQKRHLNTSPLGLRELRFFTASINLAVLVVRIYCTYIRFMPNAQVIHFTRQLFWAPVKTIK